MHIAKRCKIKTADGFPYYKFRKPYTRIFCFHKRQLFPVPYISKTPKLFIWGYSLLKEYSEIYLFKEICGIPSFPQILSGSVKFVATILHLTCNKIYITVLILYLCLKEFIVQSLKPIIPSFCNLPKTIPGSRLI